MFSRISDKIMWIFFDVGSTLVDEHLAYEHTFQDIAKLTNKSYDEIYAEAIELYKQNKKGDIELCIKYNLPKRKWHIEDEILYEDVPQCLAILSQKYKIGIIANQALGTKKRLENWGLLPYIDLIIASAEEGVSKPDPKIFEIALQRAQCNPAEAVMVGDRIDNDILPAKKDGDAYNLDETRIWQLLDNHKEEEKAEFIANNISEVCEYLCVNDKYARCTNMNSHLRYFKGFNNCYILL